MRLQIPQYVMVAAPAIASGLGKSALPRGPIPSTSATSYVERQNLTMRMTGASRDMHYNFGRIHKTRRVTPAMGSGQGRPRVEPSTSSTYWIDAPRLLPYIVERSDW